MMVEDQIDVSQDGLEARIPFLDAEFIRTYWKIKPELDIKSQELKVLA